MRIYSLSVFEQHISERRDTEEVSSEKRKCIGSLGNTEVLIWKK
jgi:hypothetical protein